MTFLHFQVQFGLFSGFWLTGESAQLKTPVIEYLLNALRFYEKKKGPFPKFSTKITQIYIQFYGEWALIRRYQKIETCYTLATWDYYKDYICAHNAKKIKEIAYELTPEKGFDSLTSVTQWPVNDCILLSRGGSWTVVLGWTISVFCLLLLPHSSVGLQNLVIYRYLSQQLIKIFNTFIFNLWLVLERHVTYLHQDCDISKSDNTWAYGQSLLQNLSEVYHIICFNVFQQWNPVQVLCEVHIAKTASYTTVSGDRS